MKALKTLIAQALLILPAAMTAQEADTIPSAKVITNAQMLGVGGVNILDTYLSPEKYTGMEVRYISHTIRRREGARWSRMLVHQGSFAYADNWDLMGGKLNIMAGGQADIDLGFLYNTRNGNNPAQARLALNISPSAAAAYRFRLGNVPLKARYEVSAPLFGVMFSPNYGQSYYEIFSRGNYDHNVVPTTIATTPSLRQMLTLDFTLGKTTLRVGYLGDFRQAKVNNLKYHTYSNMFLIGFVRTFKLTHIIP